MSKKVAAKKSPALGRARNGRTPAAAAKKSKVAAAPKVQFADIGGYRVFGTPTRPVHVTEQQIDDALASL